MTRTGFESRGMHMAGWTCNHYKTLHTCELCHDYILYHNLDRLTILPLPLLHLWSRDNDMTCGHKAIEFFFRILLARQKQYHRNLDLHKRQFGILWNSIWIGWALGHRRHLTDRFPSSVINGPLQVLSYILDGTNCNLDHYLIWLWR